MAQKHPIRVWLTVFAAALIILVRAESSNLAAGENVVRPPNILLIMADDLGFSDLGCYGGEIRTPNLDSLARHGQRLTQFYNTGRCWPTRGSLLTGYYPHQIRRDKFPGGKLGNRPAWAPLLPVRLKPGRYRGYHSGKWHIDGKPIAAGFDRSYYLRDQGRFFYPQVHFRDDRKLAPVKKSADFYGTTAIANHAIECLREHADEYSDQPFFHYLAFTAPHFPLHALPEDIERYKETYVSGWDVIRQQRRSRQLEMGLVPGKLSQVEREVGPPYHFPDALKKLGDGEVNRPVPWDSLTAQQKKFQSTKMSLHAAMVDRMDQEIGRVIQQLKRMGEFENTIIFFLSDNGASAEIMVRTDGHDPNAAPGSGPSYLCLGPGWSTVCNTPFRRHKTWVHEGGIRTPLIVHWPKGIQASGRLNAQPGHVIDLVPTLMDFAGAPLSKTSIDQPEFPGRSLKKSLVSNSSEQQRKLWWEHEGNRALRAGDLKLVAAKDEPWSLYNLAVDPAETNDLSQAQPGKVRELEIAWTKMRDEFKKLHTAPSNRRSKK